MMLVLLVAFGSGKIVSLATASLVAAATYQVFAHGLQVPLPPGWLAW